MSILSRRETALNITKESLLDSGFIEIVWGTPAGKDKNGKYYWKETRKCWEKVFTVGKLVGSMVYYPSQFDGYVTNYKSKDPADSVILFIDGCASLEDWFQIIDTTSMIGLDLAENTLRQKIADYESNRR